MSKTTTAQVERDLLKSLQGFKDQAAAVKDAHKAARQTIVNDPRRSDLAKNEDLATLAKATRSKLDNIKADQESYVSGLKSKIEGELRGSKPTDPNSVLLRRDAADRARKITDKQEAMEVLNDAIRNGDDEMAHAIGNRAQNTGMFGVAEAYQAAYSDAADSATALAHVEANTSGAAYNLSNQLTYSAPTD